MHQYHLASAAAEQFRCGRGPYVPELGSRAQRTVHRNRSRHHGPRRGLAILAAGPQPRTDRHDVADGGLGLVTQRRHSVAVGAARLRRTRRLPPNLRRPPHRLRRCSLLDHRRPVPALDHARLGRLERLPDQCLAGQPVRRHPIGRGAPTARSSACSAGVLRHGPVDGAPRQGDGSRSGRGSGGDHNGLHQLLRRRRPDRLDHRRDA